SGAARPVHPDRPQRRDPESAQGGRQAGQPRPAAPARAAAGRADAAADRRPPRLQRVLRQQELIPRNRAATKERLATAALFVWPNLPSPGTREGFLAIYISKVSL